MDLIAELIDAETGASYYSIQNCFIDHPLAISLDPNIPFSINHSTGSARQVIGKDSNNNLAWLDVKKLIPRDMSQMQQIIDINDSTLENDLLTIYTIDTDTRYFYRLQCIEYDENNNIRSARFETFNSMYCYVVKDGDTYYIENGGE